MPLIVTEIERTSPLNAANLGLSLAESKQLLARVQKELVESQLACHAEAQRSCDRCGHRRALKDYRPALSVGRRLDDELHAPVETESAEHPTDTSPISVVGLDSGYVHDCRGDAAGSYEVVVGRILCENNDSRSLGLVRTVGNDREARVNG